MTAASTIRSIVRLCTRILPSILDATEGLPLEGVDPKVVAASVLGDLAKDGYEPISSRTFELFSIAIASLVIDLEAARRAEAEATAAASGTPSVLSLLRRRMESSNA